MNYKLTISESWVNYERWKSMGMNSIRHMIMFDVSVHDNNDIYNNHGKYFPMIKI
jgi:hypothetical protein